MPGRDYLPQVGGSKETQIPGRWHHSLGWRTVLINRKKLAEQGNLLLFPVGGHDMSLQLHYQASVCLTTMKNWTTEPCIVLFVSPKEAHYFWGTRPQNVSHTGQSHCSTKHESNMRLVAVVRLALFPGPVYYSYCSCYTVYLTLECVGHVCAVTVMQL